MVPSQEGGVLGIWGHVPCSEKLDVISKPEVPQAILPVNFDFSISNS